MTDAVRDDPTDDRPASWFPMLAVAMGQTATTLNISALPVSIGGIVAEFGIAATDVGTAIVVYSVAVAGFILLGARLGRKYGATRLFRWAAAGLLLAAVLTVLSPGIGLLIAAQAFAGFGAAMLLPTLVVLITHNYSGRQQARAIGLLGAVQAAATVLAIMAAGVLGTYFSWRHAFVPVIPAAALAWWMAGRLTPVERHPHERIDGVGVLLAAVTAALISLGFDGVSDWGLLLAEPSAPFVLLGISPALLMIVAGVLTAQSFIVWLRRRQSLGLTPLLALEVAESRPERVALASLLSIVAIGSALNFMIPLYIQMVQGGSSLETARALIPYQFAVLAAAIGVIGLYGRFSPRQIARYAFMMVAAALAMLAAVVKNQWHDAWVIAGLVLVGLGQGALMTLLFNVLISATPKALAGDVGALRGAVRNLANGLGTAVAGALVIALLGASVRLEVRGHPEIPSALLAEINIDRPNFVSNARLEAFMAGTSATPAQIEEAVRINARARLQALRQTFLLLAGIALLMVLPVRRLPGFGRRARAGGEVSAEGGR